MKLFEFLENKKYISIPLKKTKTNHFELVAYINGIKGRFILDTGASNTCIGLHKADYFKVASTISETKASGAGATEIETHTATDVYLTIGKWEVRDLHLVLIDLSHVNSALELHGVKEIEGVIGSDLLKLGKAIIDYDKKRLYLKKNRIFEKSIQIVLP